MKTTPLARQGLIVFLATLGSCQIEHDLLLGSLIPKDVDPHLSLVRTKQEHAKAPARLSQDTIPTIQSTLALF